MPAVINFKIDKRIKTQAQKIAGDMGLSLSDILNVYLRKFVKTKELHIDLKDESRPSKKLLKAVEEKEKTKNFRDIKDLTVYLKKL